MLAKTIIEMIARRASKQLQCNDMQKIKFVFMYKTDELKVIAEDKLKDGKEVTRHGAPQKISDNAELNAMFTDRINKKLKPESITAIASEWDYINEKINTIVLFIKDGEKKKHEENINFNEA